MAVGIIAVFIPIIVVLVTGLVLVTFFYYRSREKQMLIEKGLGPEEIKDFFKTNKDHYRMMKIGIVCIGFGIGLGLGMMLQDQTFRDYWIPLFLFTFTGLGFVVANIVARKLEKNLYPEE